MKLKSLDEVENLANFAVGKIGVIKSKKEWSIISTRVMLMLHHNVEDRILFRFLCRLIKKLFIQIKYTVFFSYIDFKFQLNYYYILKLFQNNL